MMSVILTAGVLLLQGASGAPAAPGPPFELEATHDRFFGGTRGTLVISDEGVAFRASAAGDALRWAFADLKQVRIRSATRIELETFEDQGGLRFGVDRSYAFHVSGAVPADAVAFLLARLRFPVVTAVLPVLPASPEARVLVKHSTAAFGSQGALALYDNGFAYVTERQKDQRFWRFRDIFAVLPLDPFRLQVLAYEGGPGETNPYTFDLKEPLPEGMYDALWQRVNRPDGRPRRVGFELEDEPMKHSLTMASVLALSVAAGPAAAQDAQHPHGAPGPAPDMMAQCQKMMHDMHANTTQIEALAARMNAATGPARMAAMEELLAVLVKERTSAFAAMQAMHHPETHHGAAAPAALAAQVAPLSALDIAFRSTPDPPRMGDNALEVTLKDEKGQPVADAAVTVTFDMPAMPKMKMPAMRVAATLSHAGTGIYRGTGQVPMAGRWNVTIAAARDGQALGKKTLTLVARD